MVFSFIKGMKCHNRVEFFYALYRHFTNPHAVMPFFHNTALKLWHHPRLGATRNFYKIDVGHYGLYFSMFSHDRDQGHAAPLVNELILAHIAGYEELKVLLEQIVVVCDKLIITRANVDIQLDISQLKSDHRRISLPLQLLLGRSNGFASGLRLLHTDARVKRFLQTCPPPPVPEEPIPSATPKQELSQLIDPYLSSQLESLKTCEPNLVYPIYQLIRRNDMTLPLVEDYNFVLRSIATRPCDSLDDVNDVERKLTTLMTVYQDMLTVFKPTSETYNLVLAELVRGAIRVPTATTQFSEAHETSQALEFAHMAVSMFMSIINYRGLDLIKLIPQMAAMTARFPLVMTKAFIERLMSVTSTMGVIPNGSYYHNLIKSSQHFGRYDIALDAVYKFVLALFEQYKCVATGEDDEYVIYGAVLSLMIANGQRSTAGKFLDDILSDYKQLLLNAAVGPTKTQVSRVMLAYLSAVLEFSPLTKRAISDTSGVLRKFEAIPYLPEVLCEVYAAIISRCCHRYREMDGQRRTETNPAKLNEAMALQLSYLATMWKLYGRIAVRRDFGGEAAKCRDTLLLLSIDLGDHEHVFQLLKEMIMRSHHIYDVATLRKVLNYLYLGAIGNTLAAQPFSSQYYGLLLQIVESQGQFHQGKAFSDFMSEVARYLVLVPQAPEAAAAVYPYNVAALLNSPLVARAFESLNIAEDNLYGILVLSLLLVAYPPQGPLASRVAHLLLILCSQFEEPDNHYIELNRELLECRYQVAYAVHHLIGSLVVEGHALTPAMVDAARYVDVDIPEDVTVALSDWQFEQDLTYLLSINRNLGVRTFLSEFAAKKQFSRDTWTMLLTPEFLHEECISPKRLLARLSAGGHDDAEMLAQLVKADHDPTTICVVNHLLTSPKASTPVLVKWIVAATRSLDNRYLQELVTGKNGLFYKVLAPFSPTNPPMWALAYLSLMEDPNQVIQLVEDHICMESEHSPIIPYLDALVATNSPQFPDVYAKLPLLVQTLPQGRQAMLEYQMGFQDADYGELFGRYLNGVKSTKLRELLAQCQFYAGLGYPSHCQLVGELAWALLACGDISHMRQLALSHKHLVLTQHSKQRKEQLVCALFTNLITLVDYLSSTNVKLAINNVLKFLRMVHLHKLSVANLALFIKLLGTARLSELLHILRTKMVLGSKVADIVRFFYLETICASTREKLILLDQLVEAETTSVQ